MRLKNCRKFCIKTLIVLTPSLGVFLLAGGLINFLFSHFIFNRAILPIAQMIAEDGQLMGPTIEQLYREWSDLGLFIPLAGLVCMFFGFMVARFEKDARKGFDLTALGPPQEYTPMPIWQILILILITLAAVALRIPSINQSLWVDEITSATYIKEFRLWHYTDLGNHWLYTFLGFISTRLFGENEITLRIPIFIFGVLTVPLAYFTGRDFLTRKQALLLSGIFCASALHIFYSVDARSYIMLAFYSMLSSCLFLRLISGKFLARAKRDNFSFGVITALGCLSHFYYIWVIFAQTMTLFYIFLTERIFAKRENAIKSHVLNNLVLSMVFGCLTALLVYGPELFTAFVVKVRTWGHSGDGVSFGTLGELFAGTPNSLYGIIFTVIAIFGILDFWKNQKYLVLYSVFLAALPLLIMKFAYAIVNRYFIYTLPILYILLVRGMVFFADRCKARLIRNIVFLGMLAFYLIVQFPALIVHYQHRKSGNQDYRAVGRLIDNFAKTEDIVFAIGSGGGSVQYYIKKHKVSILTEEEFYQQLQSDKTKLWVVATFPELIRYVPNSLRIYNATRTNLKLVGYFPGKYSPLLVYH